MLGLIVGAHFVLRICRERSAALMGVLNVTPDLRSTTGRYLDEATAARKVEALVSEGADIIDVGGEIVAPRVRPRCPPRSRRCIEVAVRRAVAAGVKVSIDTTSPEVADRMLGLGAHFVNDVSCWRRSRACPGDRSVPG